MSTSPLDILRLCAVTALMLGVALSAGVSSAQDEDLSDVFGGLGTASSLEDEVPSGQKAGEGTVAGRVFDGESGIAIPGVTVILTFPPPPSGGESRIEVQVSDSDGGYEFPSVPPGTYTISFSKAGYRAATMTDFAVEPGVVNQADFPLPPLPTQASDEVLDLDAFVVEASTVSEMMTAIEMRLESDQLLDILSAEDLSKFAASDVADALKRVAGVNIVEGQFAIIRGLEDRYSSTTYNSAPVPSPDPLRQSVQLDLFPSEIVTNLVVQKTFAPWVPSNSSGGSIDILTIDYPEQWEIKLKGAAGFNQRALDGFLSFVDESPIGEEEDGDPLDWEVGAFVGGRTNVGSREFRVKALFNYETSFETREGFQEGRQPTFTDAAGSLGPFGSLRDGLLPLTDTRYEQTESERNQQSTWYLGFGSDLDEEGNHRADFSVFYTKKREEVVQLRESGRLPGLLYAPILTRARQPGSNEVDFSWFCGGGPYNFGTTNFTCRFPSGVAALGADAADVRAATDRPINEGALFYDAFFRSRSFERDRDLLVTQVNGDHKITQLPGLEVKWAANYARTTQQDTTYDASYYFEPLDPDLAIAASNPNRLRPPDFLDGIQVEELQRAAGPGQYFTTAGDIGFSTNDIDEFQYFGRLDGSYEVTLGESLVMEMRLGGWGEYASRFVDNRFVQTPAPGPAACAEATQQTFAVCGNTPQELGTTIFNGGIRGADGNFTGNQLQTSDASRLIAGANGGLKFTLFDTFDVLGGGRIERIDIESKNDALGSGANRLRFGAVDVFPTRYLFFDRLDNIDVELIQDNSTLPCGSELPGQPCINYNDLILGTTPSGGQAVPGVGDGTVPCRAVPGGPLDRTCIDVRGESALAELLTGSIREWRFFPSVGLAVRPLPGLSLRAAWSETAARPSFRELGYYNTLDPTFDEPVIGNPRLTLSDVTSYDFRAEYVYGEYGDLGAFSFFYKDIANPIESTVVRDPTNAGDGSDALFRTFFNNPNTATLWGIEVEARKNLAFTGIPLFEYLSVGGNFTYIDAQVDRPQGEIDRASRFFQGPPGASFPALEKSRRLFGQPEWIANFDVSFDQPDWGTRFTLAWFAISDVLDAAGTTFIRFNALDPADPENTVSLTVDRYIDTFDQLDLIFSQRLPWGFTFKFTAKNLTDSRRRIIYDPSQTSGRITERELQKGIDYKFSLTYSLVF